MAVVDVADVRMRVREVVVVVQMGVGLGGGFTGGVRMPVVLVVHVDVVVVERSMAVPVLVALPQDQRNSDHHRDPRGGVARVERLRQHQRRQQRADERRDGEHRGLARRAPRSRSARASSQTLRP